MSGRRGEGSNIKVLSGVMFFPRGGSAHVVRALGGELEALGHDVGLVTGSLPGGHGDARAFYADLDVHAVDFGGAGGAPMHPSYEDRPGAIDPCFALVGPSAYEAHVSAWADALQAAGAADADVLHLHHLTPLHEAARRVAPHVPVVGHLHGTELLMLEKIAAGAPAHWAHADAWVARMRDWALGCARLLLLAEGQVERAVRLLGVDADRCSVIPNGFDPQTFSPGSIDRAAFWHEQLVAAPRGWRPGEGEGSVTYSAEQLAPLAEGPVVTSCGRFTEVKRVGLLIEAWADAQRRMRRRGALVLLGGHPGEWEGEHPCDVISRTGARDVFLAGWHDHDELPDFLRASDALALASVREQFGLVLVEAMACALPCIAVDAFGPAEIIEDGRTGWLVAPDDRAALADALVDARDDHAERARRGTAARRVAVERYGWPAIARRVADVLAYAAAQPAKCRSGSSLQR
ncbi:MAG: glycosyltransferase family 4 protein [Solirubrobacteraceae bacterium]